MSFFHNRSVFGAPDDDPDVVHLRSYGCDVHFSHYERNSQSGFCQNSFGTRNLITKGLLVVHLRGRRFRYRAGDWFDIPPRCEYSVEFLTDCSLIEFCFAEQASA